MLAMLRRFKRLKNEIEDGVSRYTKVLEVDRKYQIFEWYFDPKDANRKKRDPHTSPFVLQDRKMRPNFMVYTDNRGEKESKKGERVFLKHETTSKFKPLSDYLMRRKEPESSELKMKKTKSKLSEKILYMKKKFIRLYQETVMKIPIELEVRATGNKA